MRGESHLEHALQGALYLAQRPPQHPSDDLWAATDNVEVLRRTWGRAAGYVGQAGVTPHDVISLGRQAIDIVQIFRMLFGMLAGWSPEPGSALAEDVTTAKATLDRIESEANGLLLVAQWQAPDTAERHRRAAEGLAQLERGEGEGGADILARLRGSAGRLSPDSVPPPSPAR